MTDEPTPNPEQAAKIVDSIRAAQAGRTPSMKPGQRPIVNRTDKRKADRARKKTDRAEAVRRQQMAQAEAAKERRAVRVEKASRKIPEPPDSCASHHFVWAGGKWQHHEPEVIDLMEKIATDRMIAAGEIAKAEDDRFDAAVESGTVSPILSASGVPIVRTEKGKLELP